MKIWNEIWDYVKMIIIVVVVVLVVNNVVLINAKIPSESMEYTIMTGDRIFGFRMAYGLNFDFFGISTLYSPAIREQERPRWQDFLQISTRVWAYCQEDSLSRSTEADLLWDILVRQPSRQPRS